MITWSAAFIPGVPEEVVGAGLMLAGLLVAVLGWLAWTGRYRGGDVGAV